MIDADAEIEVRWVPLQAVQFDDQVIDPGTVITYLDQLKGNDGHLAPPILNEDLTIRDGHHRLVAHIAARREKARCLIVHPAKREVRSGWD